LAPTYVLAPNKHLENNQHNKRKDKEKENKKSKGKKKKRRIGEVGLLALRKRSG
jgi:hypothetical protein